jgi:predicted RNase H-like nuclease
LGQAVVVIDIPIGLPDSDPRECESEVRRLLRHRASSVFNCPSRVCLAAIDSYEEASALSMAATGKKLSKQSFAILRKIAEVDQCLQEDVGLAARVWEVHPEACFSALAGDIPLLHSKHSGFGFLERHQLLSSRFPEVSEFARRKLV